MLWIGLGLAVAWSASAQAANQKKAAPKADKAAAQDKTKALTPAKDKQPKTTFPAGKKVRPPRANKPTPATRMALPPSALKKAPKLDPAMLGLRFSGFILAGYRMTLNTPNQLRLGESDGFYVSRARLKLAARVWYFRAVISIDGIFDNGADPQDLSPATRSLSVATRDAFMQFRHPSGFEATVGQHKVPFSMHSERSTADEHFILFPLIIAGEGVTFGRPARNIIPARDLGLTLGFNRQFGTVGFKVEAMIYNGNGENIFANDSDVPAVAARARVAIGSFLSIGGSFLFNQRRVGNDPNLLFDESELAFGADLAFKIAGFFLEGEFAASNRTFSTTGEAPAFGWGFRTDVGYRIRSIGLEFAFRFEMYDPTDQFDDDQLIYLTPAISWYYHIWANHSIAIRLNYTIKLEQTEAQTLNNDQLNLLFQYRY